MDPLTAFSLFCNIVTTVDAAIKTAKQLKELYDAPRGLTGHMERVRRSAAQLGQLVNKLDSERRKVSSESHQRGLFADIASDCKDMAGRIEEIIRECRVDDRGPRIWAVSKALFRHGETKSELDRLLSEMQSKMKTLHLSITAASEAELRTLKGQLCKHGLQQSEMMKILSSIGNDLSIEKDLLASLQGLSKAFQEAQVSMRHAAILKVLKPRAVYDREDSIRERHSETFDWIINPPDDRKSSEDSNPNGSTQSRGSHDAATSSVRTGDQIRDVGFVKWLTEGSGVFHIAGKPGSGKSTLMKFLVGEPAVRTYLEQWAASASKELIFSQFFFWKYGSVDQKTFRGLLRALLYDISVKDARVTKALFPRLWGDNETWFIPEASHITIRSRDIRDAFDKLRTDGYLRQTFRVCFFIDGLDELDEQEKNLKDLARDIKAWTEGPEGTTFMKLCVSSREEYPIMSTFPSTQRIRLQDLTKNDISTLVENTLGADEHFLALKTGNEYAARYLLDSIVKDAQGVFLWVVLLIKKIEIELSSNIASLESLENIIQTTPKELEGLIEDLLKSIENHYKHGAYFVLSMALRFTGCHLSKEGSLDDKEQAIHQNTFDNMLYNLEEYEYDEIKLPAYGIAKVLDEFPRESGAFNARPWQKWVTRQEYEAAADRAADKEIHAHPRI
ncbi:hypothetical protein JDV02_002226 [Purpureocillium takamizusanense]|uniref:Nephrocystin 3-like N-terminal domain-containing protein n=1 Tax=Purpureocillium takamizusanense TaxID=2060973 RepID=A0A9Q8Q9U5_9HYPO|nr:uncharacterized protein JDV02_002226 [Purpureocillium takamizusanense]UNI15720.1 hypothetical protein JDV02_002226 [Purpureocillium takamizusanense]